MMLSVGADFPEGEIEEPIDGSSSDQWKKNDPVCVEFRLAGWEVCVMTTAKIESCPFVVSGNTIIKSIEMTSHFDPGIACGCSNPVGCLCPAFTY
jgi:hypothetical protein